MYFAQCFSWLWENYSIWKQLKSSSRISVYIWPKNNPFWLSGRAVCHNQAQRTRPRFTFSSHNRDRFPYCQMLIIYQHSLSISIEKNTMNSLKHLPECWSPHITTANLTISFSRCGSLPLHVTKRWKASPYGAYRVLKAGMVPFVKCKKISLQYNYIL